MYHKQNQATSMLLSICLCSLDITFFPRMHSRAVCHFITNKKAVHRKMAKNTLTYVQRADHLRWPQVVTGIQLAGNRL
jgi:hypothetical protein